MRSKSSMRPLHARRVRDGEVVQHRVGRAAGRHDQRDRVLDRLARDDVARLEVVAGSPRPAPAPTRPRSRPSPRRARPSATSRAGSCRAPRTTTTWCWRCTCRRRRRRVGQAFFSMPSKSSSLILPAANAPTASNARHDGEVLALPLARLDGAAVDVDRRHVHARHRHHAARHVLVAAADDQHAVHALAVDRRSRSRRRSPRATPASTSSPSVPMPMPSVTVGTPNTCGIAPACLERRHRAVDQRLDAGVARDSWSSGRWRRRRSACRSRRRRSRPRAASRGWASGRRRG